jgi:hypothetical protein
MEVGPGPQVQPTAPISINLSDKKLRKNGFGKPSQEVDGRE